MHALDVGRTLAVASPELIQAGAPVTFAGLVPEFDMTGYVDKRRLRQLERPNILGLAAAADALDDAGLPMEPGAFDPAAFGVAVGTGHGNHHVMERVATQADVDLHRLHPSTVTRIMYNSTAALISARFGAAAFSMTYVAACASGGMAIGEAMRRIREGQVVAALAGGVDSPVSPLTVAAFARMRVLSTSRADPATASRPFDTERDGFVLSEGASFLLLEEWEHAKARGGHIYGEVAGYHTNSDAYHAVMPRPDGSTAARCMLGALLDAGIEPGEVGHINANATSTWSGDEAEGRAIQAVFGAAGPPVTAPKGVLGHMIGGAAAAEAFASLRFGAREEVAPVANVDQVQGGLGINVVVGEPQAAVGPWAVSNSLGFGGHNVSLVLSSAG
jgi:3-oxoacyl-[acyl-carrier-protein] synthase II